MNGFQLDKATGTQKTTGTKSFLAIHLIKSFVQTISKTPKLGRSIRCSVTYIHPHFTGNDKGLYATMIGGRIDPSSCLDTWGWIIWQCGGFVLPVFMV